MKKIIIFIIISPMALFLSYLGYKGIKKEIYRKQISEQRINLPKFQFQDLYGSEYANTYSYNMPVVIIYFNPDCLHCEYEAEQLLLYRSELKMAKIIMVSPASINDIKIFKKKFNLSQISNMDILWDRDNKFESYFGISPFPTIIIYDKNEKLKKKYKGEVKIETILKKIKTSED